MTMFEILLEPLQYPFMLRGMAAGVLVGIVCAVLGTYVVLRGMAFFGDALAHAVLPGLAVGYLVGGGAREPLFWWGMGTAIVTSLGIGAISRNARIKEDTAIGIIFAGMFALGIALISSAHNYTVDLTHFLFGDVLGVGASDLLLTTIFGGLILLVVFLLYKEFMVLAFDPVLAATLRLPARLLDNILIVLIAVAIMVSLQTVGVALMVAMLVTPAATAFLLTRRLWKMMGLAALIASFSAVTGLYLSYYLNVASGAAIVLTCTAVYLVVWAVTSLKRRRQQVTG
jgi:manganese/iron transport system permease protein